MRLSILMPLLALAACGGEDTKESPTSATTLQPGQYAVTAAVSEYRTVGEGTPKLNTPAGTRTTRSICLADAASPPAELFADEGFDCRIAPGAYVRNGGINVTLNCTGEQIGGEANYTVNGSFDGTGFEAERRLTTALRAGGNVVVGSRIEGRRTGACTAAPAADNGAAGNAAK